MRRTYLADDPVQGARGVRTGEDVLVHAEAARLELRL